MAKVNEGEAIAEPNAEESLFDEEDMDQFLPTPNSSEFDDDFDVSIIAQWTLWIFVF